MPLSKQIIKPRVEIHPKHNPRDGPPHHSNQTHIRPYASPTFQHTSEMLEAQEAIRSNAILGPCFMQSLGPLRNRHSAFREEFAKCNKDFERVASCMLPWISGLELLLPAGWAPGYLVSWNGFVWLWVLVCYFVRLLLGFFPALDCGVAWGFLFSRAFEKWIDVVKYATSIYQQLLWVETELQFPHSHMPR